MVPPRERIADLRARKDAAARKLKVDSSRRIKEIGCQLKDIDTGLIDFPTLYRDKEVYLCWKLGESGIGFWHHVEDGFRGRRPIDSEFLANHRARLHASVPRRCSDVSLLTTVVKLRSDAIGPGIHRVPLTATGEPSESRCV